MWHPAWEPSWAEEFIPTIQNNKRNIYKLDYIEIHNMIIDTSISKKAIHRMGENITKYL